MAVDESQTLFSSFRRGISVVDAITGQWTIGPSGSNTASSATGQHDYPYPGKYVAPIGIYSVDGGSTWNDFGDSNTSQIVRNINIGVENRPTEFQLNRFNDTAIPETTVLFKILLLDTRETLASFDPEAVWRNSADKLFDSNREVMVPFMEGETATNTSSSSVAFASVTHGLGYPPMVDIWEVPISGGNPTEVNTKAPWFQGSPDYSDFSLTDTALRMYVPPLSRLRYVIYED